MRCKIRVIASCGTSSIMRYVSDLGGLRTMIIKFNTLRHRGNDRVTLAGVVCTKKGHLSHSIIKQEVVIILVRHDTMHDAMIACISPT